jgi:hypothetical protein
MMRNKRTLLKSRWCVTIASALIAQSAGHLNGVA